MAKFVPPREPDQFTNKGERSVAKALAGALDDTYTVYHNIKWLPAEAECDQSEGETDFVIYHPKRGLLIIEVKGGQILVVDGKWYHADRGRPGKPMKEPLVQANRFRRELLARLQAVHNTFYPINCAVALPDPRSAER